MRRKRRVLNAAVERVKSSVWFRKLNYSRGEGNMEAFLCVSTKYMIDLTDLN